MMYVFGGRGFGGGYLALDKVLALNVETFVWEEKHSGGDVPPPRYLHTTTCMHPPSLVLYEDSILIVTSSGIKVVNGLFLFGGEYNNEALNDFYVFNPGNKTPLSTMIESGTQPNLSLFSPTNSSAMAKTQQQKGTSSSISFGYWCRSFDYFLWRRKQKACAKANS